MHFLEKNINFESTCALIWNQGVCLRAIPVLTIWYTHILLDYIVHGPEVTGYCNEQPTKLPWALTQHILKGWCNHQRLFKSQKTCLFCWSNIPYFGAAGPWMLWMLYDSDTILVFSFPSLTFTHFKFRLIKDKRNVCADKLCIGCDGVGVQGTGKQKQTKNKQTEKQANKQTKQKTKTGMFTQSNVV